MLTYDGTFTFLWVDSGATLQNVAAVPPRGYANTNFVTVVFDDGNVTLYVNGLFGAFFSGATGAYTTGTGFAVGSSVGGAGATNGATEALIHGIGFHTGSSTLTKEVMDWYRACLTDQTFATDPRLIASAEAWSVESGVNPSGGTWTPDDGANNLVQTGSAATITELTIPLNWA